MSIPHRSTAILLHISSLPGGFGIGDIRSGLHFIDFLSKAGVRYWQFLPTCPVAGALSYSPYMGFSAFAGNPLFISPELMVADGLLDGDDINGLPASSEYVADFVQAAALRLPLFIKAHHRLAGDKRQRFLEFCRVEQKWLTEYAVFMAAKEVYADAAWYNWPHGLARCGAAEVAGFVEQHQRLVEFHKFCQYLFFEQWRQLRSHARSMGVLLFGDMPIYVSHDSSDVWANQHCFDLDPASGEPRHVAGVPPDYFSATGQRWGNPLYLWQQGKGINADLYSWWRRRFQVMASQLDMVRIDHFRAFESYWVIPAEEETAVKGRWQPGPGPGFFKEMADVLTDLAIVAEDLGLITPAVEELRQELGFPGMKILQFAFDSDAANTYLPHNLIDPNCLIYSGTHDNDTSVGWYFDPGVSERSKARFRRYANSDGHAAHLDFMRLALASTARLAVLPMQDILGFGTDCRMNKPGTVAGNWLWRCASRYLNDDVAAFLRSENEFYGRLIISTNENEDA